METRVSRGSIALVAVLSTIGTSCKGCKTNGGDSAADPETGGHDLDSDNDRLIDWDERNVYSTDPLNPDTDGDGWNDGDEVLDHGTSPTNPYSHPYTGDYKVGDCADYPDKSKAHPNGSRTVEAEGAALRSFRSTSRATRSRTSSSSISTARRSTCSRSAA